MKTTERKRKERRKKEKVRRGSKERKKKTQYLQTLGHWAHRGHQVVHKWHW